MSGRVKNQKKSKYVQNANLLILTESEKLLNECIKKSNGRLIDLTGQKFGMLTVIKYAGPTKKIKKWSDGGASWVCKCDCGEECIAIGTRLRRGITKSCGNHWTLEEGEASLNAKISCMKHSAKRRGIEWRLEKEQVREILIKNCIYCGAKPSYRPRGGKKKSINGHFICNGIDRIDSHMGYESGNVVPCCPDCNKAKLDHSLEDFVGWFKRIASHNKWDCDLDSIKFSEF